MLTLTENTFDCQPISGLCRSHSVAALKPGWTRAQSALNAHFSCRAKNDNSRREGSGEQQKGDDEEDKEKERRQRILDHGAGSRLRPNIGRQRNKPAIPAGDQPMGTCGK
ncbi:unnamed protein product [Prorocentrum cordatum]|uniref:Uncharacterized protein n=1 Tax=Prorocentrum cordatum TaxID=2364126 RepID=A0ABN9XEG7_9DINO|nr:unnamed protein product [Polarella glacialis]